jgi:exonuclease III
MSVNPLQFGFWNMRGLNDPLKQKEVRSFVNKNKLSVIGLVEHKIKEHNFSRVFSSMIPFWSFVHNYTNSSSGRICIGWDPTIVKVFVLAQTSQAIHCGIHSVTGDINFTATFVYGSNDYHERDALWQFLSTWNNPGPWVILGDFNALRYPSDKVGGDPHWPSYMDDFAKCIAFNELEDLKYTGCHFTWSNKQDPSHVVTTKIDRVLVNEQWIKMFFFSVKQA